jgi:putative FmdB family regulatory protein
MPIYAYRCEACGHAKDVLQKISDPVLTDCPACGAPAFKKQVTAAGFQLKGSGWYVTDFRGGNPAAGEAAKPGVTAKPDNSTGGEAAPAAAPAASSSPAPAASTPAAAPTPASGGSSSSGGQ